MRNKRIFLGLLLVIALMAFVGCSSNDPDTTVDPNANDSVTDQKNEGMYDDGINNGMDDLGNDADRAIDNAGSVVDDLVTDSAIDNQNNNL